MRKLLAILAMSLSRRRREKFGLLVREAAMGLAFSLRPNEPPIVTDPAAEHLWHSTSTAAIDPSLFEASTKGARQDRLAPSGQVETSIKHRVVLLTSASCYSNETTHRSIFDSSDRRQTDLSYRLKAGSGPDSRRLQLGSAVQGRTANLYGNVAMAGGNYAHWLIDGLARLFLIERFHPLDSIDQVLVPPMRHDFQRQSLAVLGFDASKTIELAPLQCRSFQSLVASTPPRGCSSSVCPPWAIDGFQRTLGRAAMSTRSPVGPKLYVSRRDSASRQFENEEALCDHLEARGFEVIELSALDLFDKIAAFRDAECVIGQTGAGLTNLMFSRPGTTVVELVDDGFVEHLFASIAAHRGVVHRAHIFKNDSAASRVNRYEGRPDFDIDALMADLDSWKV